MASVSKAMVIFWAMFAAIFPIIPGTDSKRLMVILLDGFRWDYFDIHGMGLKGFPKLFHNGTRAEYTVVDFPTLSYPNYYTIMTGLYSDIHGMVGNFMYDEQRDKEFLIGGNPEYNQSYWWDGGDPLWITATRQKRSAYMYYWPNCEVVIRGLLPSYCAPYAGKPSREDFNHALMDGLGHMEMGKADLVGIYYELTDHIGHKYGPRSQELTQVIHELDEDVYRLLEDLERRELQDEIDLMFFSDHGMTEVSEQRTLNINDYVDVNDVDRIMERGAFMDIWPKMGKLNQVYSSLVNVSGHMHVYKKEESPEHWRLRKHYRIAPILISMELGWMILKPNETYWYYNDSQPLSGTHGYDNDEPDMRGIFVATGPSFRTSFVSNPINAVDIYQMMCKSLSIPPSPHNGTWERVAEMWTSSARTNMEHTFTQWWIYLTAMCLTAVSLKRTIFC